VGYQPFPNTHWSLVRRAGAADEAARREALTNLLTRYYPALRSYLCVVRRLPTDHAEDLLQAFIADRVLEYELLRHADERRGKFRTLLLTSLNNFAISQERARRLRSPSSGVQPPEESPPPTPAAIVEAEWARTLVNNVLQAMHEECVRSGRDDVWLVFEGRLLAEAWGNMPVISYDVLMEKLKLRSPSQAANLLVTAKRMYLRLLRSAVSEYEKDDSDIDTELASLRDVLAAAKIPSVE
jgi:hypothetical protein